MTKRSLFPCCPLIQTDSLVSFVPERVQGLVDVDGPQLETEGALGRVRSSVMLMVMGVPCPPVLFRPKISKVLAPSARETSPAQVARQSNEATSVATPSLTLTAMLVLTNFVPKSVMVDWFVKDGYPPRVGVSGVRLRVCGSPQSCGPVESSPHPPRKSRIPKTAQDFVIIVYFLSNLAAISLISLS